MENKIIEYIKKCENCENILKAKHKERKYRNKEAYEAVIFYDAGFTVKAFDDSFHYYCNNECYIKHRKRDARGN